MIKRAKEVPLYKIADYLPVGKWFTHKDFAKATGITYPHNSNRRLHLLIDDGFLEVQGVGVKRTFLMENEHRLAMILKSKSFKRQTGKNRKKSVKTKDGRIKCVKDAEVLAHKIAAEKVLKACNFI